MITIDDLLRCYDCGSRLGPGDRATYPYSLCRDCAKEPAPEDDGSYEDTRFPYRDGRADLYTDRKPRYGE